MHYNTVELRNVSQMALLSGRPEWSRTEQGVGQRLVVSEESELPPLQKETEVANSGVGSQEFSVKGGVVGLGSGEFPGQES